MRSPTPNNRLPVRVGVLLATVCLCVLLSSVAGADEVPYQPPDTPTPPHFASPPYTGLSCTTPKLIGLRFPAVRRAVKRNACLRFVDVRGARGGTVVRQSPAPHARIHAGAKLHVTLRQSKGRAR